MKYYRRKPLETAYTLITSVTQPVTAPAGLPLDAPAIGVPTSPGVPNNAMLAAAALVQQAADILDTEMASGVLAAHAASPGWGTPATGQPADIGGQILRRQVHDFIDALADSIAQLETPVGQWIADTVQAAGMASSIPGGDGQSVTLLSPAAAVSAGGKTKLSFTLHNDSDQRTQFTLFCTDLYNPTGYRIADNQVQLSQWEVSLGPDAQAAITVEIGVPYGTIAGTYSGLLMASDLTYLRAVLAVTVQ